MHLSAHCFGLTAPNFIVLVLFYHSYQPYVQQQMAAFSSKKQKEKKKEKRNKEEVLYLPCTKLQKNNVSKLVGEYMNIVYHLAAQEPDIFSSYVK